jgi:hypothetical protein
MRETIKAAHAFDVYWQMGDQRTLAKVGQALGKSATIIEHWSAAHGWQERIKARDREQAAAIDAEKIRQLADIEARLIADGIEAQQLAMDTLKALANDEKLDGRSAVMLLGQARAAMLRGLRQPESITRQETTGRDGSALTVVAQRADLSRLSADELDQLAALVAKTADA